MCSSVTVVYPFFSTSNHNTASALSRGVLLYIRSFLHQTTTQIRSIYISFRCISVLFYIKPQLVSDSRLGTIVVYPFFSTSNHNVPNVKEIEYEVVYPFFSTSNHNPLNWFTSPNSVVYPFFSTSNHNPCGES